MGIQLFKPHYEIEECLKEIRDCLEKGWTGLGYKTIEFEKAWKEYTQLPFAYYVNSATIGLYFAVDILKEKHGWNDGDEIITTPLTFVSTNHAILKSKLTPVFADVDETLCLSPKSVRERITEKSRAVIFVGMGGNTGNYKEIVKICAENGLALILDAAHMAGTRLDGEIPGKEAEAVIYSFQAVKNLPTADSGMLCFKDGDLDAIARKKGWLGINKDTYTRTSDTGNYKWRYEVDYVGDKGHGNSIMAAIGLAQLKYLDRDNAYRRQIATWYRAQLQGHEEYIKTIPIAKGCESSTHLFQVIVNNRDEVMMRLNSQGIFPGVHYANNKKYSMYKDKSGECPYAEYVSEHIISLPMHMELSYEDVKYITKSLMNAVDNKLDKVDG